MQASSLSFNLGSNNDLLLPMQIQFNNGTFAGFVANDDFAFHGAEYQLQLQGTSLSIYKLDGVSNSYDPNGNPTGNSLVNGYLNFGLTNQTPYTIQVAAVPEPSTWAMMIVGFCVLGFIAHRKRVVRSA